MRMDQIDFQYCIELLSQGKEGSKALLRYLAPNSMTLLARTSTVASSYTMFVLVRLVTTIFSSQAVKTEDTHLVGPVEPVEAPNFWIIILSSIAVLVHGGFQWFYLLSEDTHKTIAAFLQSISTIGISEYFRQDKKIYDPPAFLFMMLASPGIMQLLFFALGQAPTRKNMRHYLEIAHKFCRDNELFTLVRVGASTASSMTAFVGSFIENYYNSVHEKNLEDSKQHLLIAAIVGFLVGAGANNAARWHGDVTAQYIKNELPPFLMRMFLFYNFYQTFNIWATPVLIGPNSVEKFKEQEVQNNIIFVVLFIANCLNTAVRIKSPHLLALRHPYIAISTDINWKTLRDALTNVAIFGKNAIGWQAHGVKVEPRIEELAESTILS